MAVAIVDDYDVRLPDAAIVSNSGDGHVLTRHDDAHSEQKESWDEIQADQICPRFCIQEGFEVGPHAVRPPWMLAARHRLIPVFLHHAILTLEGGNHLLGENRLPMFHSEYGNHIAKFLRVKRLDHVRPVELLLH